MYSFAKTSYRKMTDWSSGFKKLYDNPDKDRQPEEFWNATMAHLSGIGEAIRKTHYKDILKSAAHAFCWMCSYVEYCNNTEDLLFKFNHPLSEIVGLKYPGICGHCLEKTCVCYSVKMDKQKDKSAKYLDLLNEWKKRKYSDYTFEMWFEDFWNIYSGQIHIQVIESIGFHLLEEAGEEAKAVRELIQFRGILDAKFDEIGKDFLINISSISGLVNEYERCIDVLRKKFNIQEDKKIFKNIDLTSVEPDFIKMRIVKAKMDFVIELADTFSWFCAVLLKLEEIIKCENLTDEILKTFCIEESLKEIYKSEKPDEPLKCYACGKVNCECKFFLEK